MSDDEAPKEGQTEEEVRPPHIMRARAHAPTYSASPS